MKKIAATLPGGYVIADNDISGVGQETAKKIGWPYWCPEEPGMDMNDAHIKHGIFKVAQSLLKVFKK